MRCLVALPKPYKLASVLTRFCTTTPVTSMCTLVVIMLIAISIYDTGNDHHISGYPILGGGDHCLYHRESKLWRDKDFPSITQMSLCEGVKSYLSWRLYSTMCVYTRSSPGVCCCLRYKWEIAAEAI